MGADPKENGKALHKELYRPYFVQDRNLALKTVLLEAVESVGLDFAAAESVIDKREYKETVDQSWMRARQMQISGVPSFIGGGYITSGYHPYDELVKFIEYVETQGARA